MQTAEDIEAYMRQKLEGKFYLTDGRDAMQVKRDEEAMKAAARAQAERKQIERRRRLQARNAAIIEMEELRKITNQITPRRILVAVSYAHGIPIADILGPSRSKKIVYARQHACHAMRHIAKMKFPAIGDELARDHTTAMHSAETWQLLQTKFPNEVALVNKFLFDRLDE